MTRISKRLCIYLRKAAEFKLVHEEMAELYAAKCSNVNSINLAISTTVTMALSTGLGGTLLPGMATVVAGMLKSWVLYAKYDTLEEGHETASSAFKNITAQITDLLAEVADAPPTKVGLRELPSPERGELRCSPRRFSAAAAHPMVGIFAPCAFRPSD